MADGTDAEENEPFAEYGDLDEKYGEPAEESLGPDIPEAPDLADREVDPVIEGTFWTLVVVFNVGLIAFSVGIMLVVFEQNLALGGQVTLAGAVILAYGFYRYRSAKQVIRDRAETGTTDEADGEDTNQKE